MRLDFGRTDEHLHSLYQTLNMLQNYYDNIPFGDSYLTSKDLANPEGKGIAQRTFELLIQQPRIRF